MRRNAQFLIGVGTFILLFLFIAGYTYYRTADLMRGPVVIITSPQNGETVTDELLTISGIITNATAVSLDDRKIFLTEKGEFKEKLLLAPGYTIMSIKAEDRFKRRVEKKVEVVFNKSI